MNILINHTYKEDTTDSFLFEQWALLNSDWSVMSRKNGNIKFSEGYLGVLKNLLRIILRKPQKIYLTTTPFHNVLLLILIKLFKPRVEITYHVHDLYPDFFKYTEGYKVFYYVLALPFKWAIKQVRIIAISEEIENNLIASYGCEKKNILLIENFANVAIRNMEDVSFESRLLYLGNIGFAHDTSIATELKELPYTTVFKLSGIKKYHKRQNENLNRILNSEFEIIKERLSIEALENLVDTSFASVVFLGQHYDKVLFPCKIYSSLARLVPIVFCGPESSYVCRWIESNQFGVHIHRFELLVQNRQSYIKSINTFNQINRIKSLKL